MRIAAAAALLGMSLISGSAFAQAQRPAYAAGQVWQYRARPDDAASLLKIQAVESDPALTRSGPIYHISIIGIHLGTDRRLGEIGHLPVSKATLDESVTQLVKTAVAFPDATPGIASWRAARGGVFTISVAEIVDIVDKRVLTPAGS
ncbi:MAG TPA: hypothetical protein VG248_14945 [Caulobacteraceae bacterium]|jgi:hypothetical protein|nr:hypothetical protein [Caulobacteraceae bacterium]